MTAPIPVPTAEAPLTATCTALAFVGVDHHISNDNLHIRCQGFAGPQACAILNLVRHYQTSCGRIFIDLRNAPRPCPTAARCWQALCRQTGVSPERIFFKVARGSTVVQALAVDGNRVIVLDQAHHGHGQCRGCGKCRCGKAKGGQASHT